MIAVIDKKEPDFKLYWKAQRLLKNQEITWDEYMKMVNP